MMPRVLVELPSFLRLSPLLFSLFSVLFAFWLVGYIGRGRLYVHVAFTSVLDSDPAFCVSTMEVTVM